jgi:L,D-transpeptidase ErfK/SrfK
MQAAISIALRVTSSSSLLAIVIIHTMLINACSFHQGEVPPKIDSIVFSFDTSKIEKVAHFLSVKVPSDIRIKNYYHFLESIVEKFDTLSRAGLNEYALVHANSWILDSLRASDYYIQKKRGKFIEDQGEMIILHEGNELIVPDSAAIALTNLKLKSTVVDLNIPEYTLRVIQLNDTVLTCKVRVGRNAEKFLPVVGKVVNLRTPIGNGEIVKIQKMPVYRNPETGERYERTKRDDGNVTKMPIIPSLEPSIDKVRHGKMIHATTNPNTLGKAVSHGCIGTTEADAWTIYYNSPIGSKVIFRYDLKIIGAKGDTLLLKDIYKFTPSR